MKNYNELSDNKQVCIVQNPNSQSAAVSGRSFSITKSGLCVSVLLNNLDIPITIQRGRKLGYALPVKTRYEMTSNSKQKEVVDCPNHRDKICILRRLQKIKGSSGLVKSLKSETDDGLSSCLNFPERPTLDEMQSDKADFGCCNFVEREIELEENAIPHMQGATRMSPHKSDACRKEIETLLEYDMIEPSKSPWACVVLMAKKKGYQLRFCCDFRYLNSVTVKDAYPIPRPNAEEPNLKPMEFSPIDSVEDTTGNTPETLKDDSQAKRTSFTEKLSMMVGMKSRDAVTEELKAERGKTFRIELTKTTGADQSEDQARPETADNNRATVDHETTSLELGNLMAKLEQIDKKLKHSEEDREVIRKELRYNKHEYLDNYFNLARATEEKIQQMSDKVNATDEEREKNIKKDQLQMKKRYDDVNSQLGSLETRMEAMSRTQAESSCAIQAKLDAILRNSTSQDRPAADR